MIRRIVCGFAGRVLIALAVSLAEINVQSAHALTADQLLLIVNKNAPEGIELAEFYAKTRKVPPGRIVELDLPFAEQMSFDTYERMVVPPLREFLRQGLLDDQIKCLVTFYGVPFRIAGRVANAETKAETDLLREQLKQVVDNLNLLTGNAEAMAVTVSPGFKPLVPGSPLADPDGVIAIDNLARRVEFAGKAIVTAIGNMTDADQKEIAKNQFLGLVGQLRGPLVGLPEMTSASQPATARAAGPLSQMQRNAFEDQRYDPYARQAIREDAAAGTSPFSYAKLLIAQIGYLSSEESEAATDSELSLLHIPFYNRARWQMNSLNYRFGMGASKALMVSRLDGPDPKIVHNVIVESIEGELRGLHGKFVIDSRGLTPSANRHDDPYVVYDQSLRRLSVLIKSKTQIPVVFDDQPEVLPAHSQSDVSLYCGWYSLSNYIPACSFEPGAVGFHIASYEMVSLRDPNNNGWVRGLLKDGIAATLGPVSEPFLQSFPMPDEFFPLLLTGKLTLAEVYWKTEMMSSWRQCLVGDPLYCPYAGRPAMAVSDLPGNLQRVFGINAPATTQRSRAEN